MDVCAEVLHRKATKTPCETINLFLPGMRNEVESLGEGELLDVVSWTKSKG